MWIAGLAGLPVLAAVLGWLAGERSAYGPVSAALSTGTVIVAIALDQRVLTRGPLTVGNGLFYVDALGGLILTLVALVGCFAAFYSIPYLRRERATGELSVKQVRTYYLAFHFFIATMLMVSVVNNLGLLWAFIEATTLVSAVLVGIYHRAAALEAAWKYILICSAGISFALLGLLLLYAAGHRVGLSPEAALGWTTLMAVAPRLDPVWVKLGFLLVLVGFGTKAGLAPMHAWLPDAHSQAPSPVSALLSGVLLNTAVYGLLRIYLIAGRSLGREYPGRVLVTFGIISLLVAVFFILVQRDFKRLLAYSSVEHIGLITTAVGLAGPLGLYGAMLHMAGHSMVKPALFFLSGELVHHYRSRSLTRIRGVLTALPALGVPLVLTMLAIAGVPPFSLFASEFSIIAAGFGQGRLVATVLVLVGIGLAFAGLTYHMVQMAFGERPTAGGDIAGDAHVSRWALAAALLPLAAVTVLGMHVPEPVRAALTGAAAVLEGGVLP